MQYKRKKNALVDLHDVITRLANEAVKRMAEDMDKELIRSMHKKASKTGVESK